jgi:DNA-binding CsgD family transcriptional regulator
VLTLSKELSSLGERIGKTAPVSPPSLQEIEILKMFAAGSSPAKIAKKLGISSQTLRNHLHHINQKLRTHNRLEAVMHAMQRKLIQQSLRSLQAFWAWASGMVFASRPSVQMVHCLRFGVGA